MSPSKVCGSQSQMGIRRYIPVLARIEDDVQPGIFKKKARRCLFGRVNHREITELLQNFQAAVMEKKSARWNFDFENGCPLPGDISWEPAREGVPRLSSFPVEVSKRIAQDAALQKPTSGKQTTLNDFFRQQKTTPPAIPEKRKSFEGVSPSPVPKLTKFTMKSGKN